MRLHNHHCKYSIWSHWVSYTVNERGRNCWIMAYKFPILSKELPRKVQGKILSFSTGQALIWALHLPLVFWNSHGYPCIAELGSWHEPGYLLSKWEMWFALIQGNIMEQLPHPKEDISVASPDDVQDNLYLCKKVVLAS